ncbi:LysE family translocator [Cellulophaga sp. E16_2]|uniref:Lysine exporter protein (LYSE/YGGA) n=1 Tax=Cellulophaga algicola (strain DSM 14237 / IC166 / ACAM 630) TaxID=688270 RepID=E6X9T5_CELAD|nr:MULTISPECIES: LysE family translocator [Cellulophaga]ADV49855.1 Lysine exporter protein (LYSE/YGGA) [Cellulophaga algicola DSM 14237]MBO0592237.1 LysE family translocator [Cellulophaga sp. E16_2]
MGIENFVTFMLTALIFMMTPGIDTVFVLNTSIGQGRKSGIYATLGINTGVLTHTLFAALGLSVLLSKSVMAFSIIKYVGALYLIYLGISKLKSTKNILPITEDNRQPKKVKSDFWSGFLTNTLNPKVALFVLAFFPQFITPSQLENPIPFILLGLTFAFIGTIWYLGLTFFASTFSHKIKTNPSFSIWSNKLSGFVFILMGIKIALSGR